MIEFMTVYEKDGVVTKVRGSYDGPNIPDIGTDIDTVKSFLAEKNMQFMGEDSEGDETYHIYRKN